MAPRALSDGLEVLVFWEGRWHICHLGLVRMNDELTPVWADRCGEVVCRIGDQDRLQELEEIGT